MSLRRRIKKLEKKAGEHNLNRADREHEAASEIYREHTRYLIKTRLLKDEEYNPNHEAVQNYEQALETEGMKKVLKSVNEAANKFRRLTEGRK